MSVEKKRFKIKMSSSTLCITAKLITMYNSLFHILLEDALL